MYNTGFTFGRAVWLLVVAVFAATSVFAAETLQGRVVKVADGDTITLLDAANMQHRIRLDKIDAPEKNQPFGDASRKHLAALVAGKIVEVEWTKKDKYGRILGTIWALLPARTDVNLQMVEDGFAWHYRHFDSTPSYAAAETAARRTKRGLWKAPAPIPPWTFRKARKRLHTNRNLTMTRRAIRLTTYNANGSSAGSATRTG